ncbi:MAG: hypothetical protein CMB49_05945 [Euryarchaeota archaeon]|nr:hypothetical protein [Euryarchaeota archaeon]
MVDMNNVIYVLSGILIVLSLQLVIRTLRKRKYRSENIWHVPSLPSKSRRSKRKARMPAQPQVPPPAYMFRQR